MIEYKAVLIKVANPSYSTTETETYHVVVPDFSIVPIVVSFEGTREEAKAEARQAFARCIHARCLHDYGEVFYDWRKTEDTFKKLLPDSLYTTPPYLLERLKLGVIEEFKVAAEVAFRGFSKEEKEVCIFHVDNDTGKTTVTITKDSYENT